MGDDLMQSALTHGVAIIGGGGASGIVTRFLFGSFSERIAGLEGSLRSYGEDLKKHGERSDQRHDKLIEDISKVRTEIERALKDLSTKVDERHEKLIVELERVRSQAEAAHRRLDELNVSRRRK